MSFNFAELQQKANRVIHNSDEFVRKWIEFISAPAGNINLEYYDQNGNLRTVSFPNRNKLVQDFIANTSRVMSKTVYVDQANGDDGNDGNANAPFKTLQKAVDSVPVGGYAIIKLKSKQVHVITGSIYVLNKILLFVPWDNEYPNLANNAWIENKSFIGSDNANQTTGFILRGGAIHFHYVNIRTANYADNTKPLSIREGFFTRWDHVSVKVNFFKSIIEIGDTDLVRIPSGPNNITDLYFYSCDIKQVGPNRAGFVLLNEFGNASIADRASSITLRNGASGNMADLISGQIVRNAATGAPLNFLANFYL